MDNEKIIKKLESFEKAAINDAARKAAVFIGEDKTENQKFAEKQEFAFLEEAYGRNSRPLKELKRKAKRHIRKS